jgi:hypothetical protein
MTRDQGKMENNKRGELAWREADWTVQDGKRQQQMAMNERRKYQQAMKPNASQAGPHS